MLIDDGLSSGRETRPSLQLSPVMPLYAVEGGVGLRVRPLSCVRAAIEAASAMFRRGTVVCIISEQWRVLSMSLRQMLRAADLLP